MVPRKKYFNLSGFRLLHKNLLNHFDYCHEIIWGSRVNRKGFIFLWFLDFVEVWQELEFWKVLNGRKIEHDRAEFIEEIYQITVRFLDDPLNGEVQ